MLYPRVCVFWGCGFRSSTERRGWMRCDWGEPCGIHWPIGKHKNPMKVKVWEYTSLETDTFFWCVLKTVSSKIKQCDFNLNFWRNWRNNVPAHSALSVKQFLAEKPITVLDHPLYSPDPSCTMQLFSFQACTQGNPCVQVCSRNEEENIGASETTNGRRPTALLWSVEDRMQRCGVAEEEYIERERNWNVKFLH